MGGFPDSGGGQPRLQFPGASVTFLTGAVIGTARRRVTRGRPGNSRARGAVCPGGRGVFALRRPCAGRRVPAAGCALPRLSFRRGSAPGGAEPPRAPRCRAGLFPSRLGRARCGRGRAGLRVGAAGARRAGRGSPRRPERLLADAARGASSASAAGRARGGKQWAGIRENQPRTFISRSGARGARQVPAQPPVSPRAAPAPPGRFASGVRCPVRLSEHLAIPWESLGQRVLSGEKARGPPRAVRSSAFGRRPCVSTDTPFDEGQGGEPGAEKGPRGHGPPGARRRPLSRLHPGCPGAQRGGCPGPARPAPRRPRAELRPGGPELLPACSRCLWRRRRAVGDDRGISPLAAGL